MHSWKGALVQVRLAQASDASGIGKLYPAFLASYGHHSDQQSSRQFVAKLLSEPWVRFFVATEGGSDIIGFLGGALTYSAVSHGHAFVINDIFVDLSARRRGVAKALIAALDDYCRGSGLVKIFVEVSEDAEAVSGMFKRAGYRLQSHLTLKKELNVGATSKI